MTRYECWPSLEVAVKASQYRGYLLLEFMKRFYDGASIIERYDCGDMTLHAHGMIGDGWYCETFHRGITDDCRPDLGVCDNQATMLVGVGNLSESECPTTMRTIKRLQSLDRCLVLLGKDGEPDLPLPRLASSRTLGIEEVGFPALNILFNQELRALLDLSSVQVNELEHEIIERGSQIIDYLSNKDGYNLRNAIVHQLKNARNAAAYAYAPFECGFDFDLQPRKMFFCPSYSRERIIKRWLAIIGRGHVR